MTKNSHVLSSISTMAMILLPILFTLGMLLSEVIYSVMTILSDDWSVFFTVSGIITLIIFLIPPPPNKKKRSIFLYTIKTLWKKFSKPKLTEEIKFDSNVVHFATVQESTKDTFLNDEKVDEDRVIAEWGPSNKDQHPQKKKSIFSITLRKYTKNWLLYSKMLAPFKKIRSFFLKNTLFKNNHAVFICTLFLMGTNSTKMDWIFNRFGGVAFESGIKPQNQLQLEVKNAFKR